MAFCAIVPTIRAQSTRLRPNDEVLILPDRYDATFDRSIELIEQGKTESQPESRRGGALVTVTAVMLTGDTRRRPLVKVAIECFQEQTYVDSELLIVNHSGERFDVAHGRIRELVVRRPDTLGDLRNIGLDNSQGEYVISWDDDDWHHPRRIEAQLEACDDDHDAVVLRTYLVLDLTTAQFFGRSCCRFECGGCCGTILHRRGAERYSARERSEDGIFVRAFRGRLRVLDNAPFLYIRTYSGLNVSPREHIVENPRRFSQVGLSQADMQLACEVQRVYASALPSLAFVGEIQSMGLGPRADKPR